MTNSADSATSRSDERGPVQAVRGPVQAIISRVRATLVRSRVVVVLVLVAAGFVWAIIRGIPFYGVSPAHLAYDLDQPPWLLVLVGGWLWYRSRRR